MPQRLGPYRLLKLLARGGMAEVWLARKTASFGASQTAVIKRVLPEQAQNREFATAFIDEARLSSRLVHPNIVRVLDVGEHEGLPFIALEPVDGIDLERLLNALAVQQRRLPVPLAVRIAVQVLRALAYAHTLTDESGASLDVVHRDVSPPNILIDRNGVVKLSDFGIAKAKGRLTRTRVGLLKGKAPYLSPEQSRAQQLDGRSDLFSLGAVLWECLTGQRLFDGDSDLAVIEQVRAAVVTPPSHHRAEVDSALDRIVGRLLAAKPDDRYPDAAAVAADLGKTAAFAAARAEALAGLVQDAAPESFAGLRMPTTAWEVRAARRRWAWPAAVAVLVLAGVALWRWSAESPWRFPTMLPEVSLAGATLIVHPQQRGLVAYWDGKALGVTPVAERFAPDGKTHTLALLGPGRVGAARNVTFEHARTIGSQAAPPVVAGVVTMPDETWSIGGDTWDAGERVFLPAGLHEVRDAAGKRRWLPVLPSGLTP